MPCCGAPHLRQPSWNSAPCNGSPRCSACRLAGSEKSQIRPQPPPYTRWPQRVRQRAWTFASTAWRVGTTCRHWRYTPQPRRIVRLIKRRLPWASGGVGPDILRRTTRFGCDRTAWSRPSRVIWRSESNPSPLWQRSARPRQPALIRFRPLPIFANDIRCGCTLTPPMVEPQPWSPHTETYWPAVSAPIRLSPTRISGC